MSNNVGTDIKRSQKIIFLLAFLITVCTYISANLQISTKAKAVPIGENTNVWTSRITLTWGLMKDKTKTTEHIKTMVYTVITCDNHKRFILHCICNDTSCCFKGHFRI